MSTNMTLLKAMSPETRREYVASHLPRLVRPHYEGGWWFQMAGHYPLDSLDYDYKPMLRREGHSGTCRADCPECWLAKLKEMLG